MNNSERYQGAELEIFSSATNWRRYWSNIIRPFLGDRVLEVGAGIGSITIMLSQRTKEWISLEPDELQANSIRKRIQTEGIKNTRVVTGTISSIPHEQKFDSILYIDVLEHIADDSQEVAVAYNHLEQGGKLIILAPAHQALYSPFDESIGHYRRYDHIAFEKIKPRSAVQVRTYYLDSIGLFASIANKIILRTSLPTDSQVQFWDKLLVPLSAKLDAFMRFKVGKSILVIWQKPINASQAP